MPGRFYLISGSDEFAVKNRARELAESLAGGVVEENADWELLRGDSPEVTDRMLLGMTANSLCTPPFFGTKKTVWCMNFAGFADLDGGDAEMKATVKRLMEILKSGLNDNIDFLWSGPGLDQRKAAAKALKAIPDAHIEILNTANPRNKDYALSMQTRLQEISRSWGKSLDARAAEFLIHTVGADSGRLLMEVEKIFTFAGDRQRVTLEDCQAVISATPEALGWELSGALQAQDASGALSVVNTLIRQLKGSRSGGFELSMLYTAIGAFTDVLNTRKAMTELSVPNRIGPNYFSGLDPALKEKFPDNVLLGMHPFRAYKLCETVSRFSDSALKTIFAELLNANLSLVTGRGDARIVLEQMILNICRAR